MGQSTPNNIPNLEYITAIETMCPKLKKMHQNSEQTSMHYLGKGKAPKPNLNKQERIGLTQLKKDQDRVILTADKGMA